MKANTAKNMAVIVLCAVMVVSASAYVTGRIPFLLPRFPNSPTPAVDAQPQPLGTPPAYESTPGEEYQFASTQSDEVTPITWDACRPIRYVINPDGMPSGFEPLLHKAVDEIAAATGYSFIFDGYSSEPYQPVREPYQPGRYGDRWAPVLVSFIPEGTQTSFEGNVVGHGGATTIGNPGRPEFIVSGRMTFETEPLESMARFDKARGTSRVYLAVLHELGHVIGLDHPDDPNQLMFARENPWREGLQPGDLAGLAALNTGECAPWL